MYYNIMIKCQKDLLNHSQEHKNTAPLLKRQKIHNACADFRGVYLNVVRVYTHMMYAVVFGSTFALSILIPEILIQDQRPIEVETQDEQTKKNNVFPNVKKFNEKKIVIY